MPEDSQFRSRQEMAAKTSACPATRFTLMFFNMFVSFVLGVGHHRTLIFVENRTPKKHFKNKQRGFEPPKRVRPRPPANARDCRQPPKVVKEESVLRVVTNKLCSCDSLIQIEVPQYPSGVLRIFRNIPDRKTWLALLIPARALVTTVVKMTQVLLIGPNPVFPLSLNDITAVSAQAFNKYHKNTQLQSTTSTAYNAGYYPQNTYTQAKTPTQPRMTPQRNS